MSKLQIITDSCCNLSRETIDKLGLEILSLAYIVDGVEKLGYVKGEAFDYDAFYQVIKSKVPASTSQVTTNQAKEMCEPILQAGNDIVYIGFSSALSGTYNAVALALDELKGQYSDRQIFHIDSLAATVGQGILVIKACEMRDEGKNAAEIHAWVEANKQKIQHFFTVEDLFYLKRGGRLSAVKAIMGTALNIKPILTVSLGGKLIPIGKAKGRKKALETLAEKVVDIDAIACNKIWVVHTDALEDANYTANILREKHKGLEVEVINLEPVVGTHTGPGVAAVIFVGTTERTVQ